jgi:hypothetical protein
MRKATGEKAWVALTLGIILYEIFAPPEQLLSEAIDRLLLRHPVLVRVGIMLVALHLINALPSRYDPIHHTATIFNMHGTRAIERYNGARLVVVEHKTDPPYMKPGEYRGKAPETISSSHR